MTAEQFEAYEQKEVHRLDGHWCNDWDGLAVNAWSMEYDCCTDYTKSRLGRIVNWFMVKRFNFGWWWTVGRHKH